MTATMIENRDWQMVSGGLWVADFDGHHFAAANHPRVYPRGWHVTDNGQDVIFVHTLKEAQDWVRCNYCERGWTVHADDHGSFVHHCVALTVDRTGPMTHREALAEAGRLNAARDAQARLDELALIRLGSDAG